MNILIFYVAAIALFGLSIILIRQASPFSRVGSYVYEQKRKRRLVGQVLLVVATLALVIGLIAQLIASYP